MEGISGLEHVDLSEIELTTEQLTRIFTRLSVVEDQKLKTLDLCRNDHSSVLTETLVVVISGLECVYLDKTRLTTQQLTKIYRMVADRRCPQWRWINLKGHDLSSIPQVLLHYTFKLVSKL